MEGNQERCTNCRQVPEEILMLGCDHDLCLNCAATIFVGENPSGVGKLLTCLECGKSTELDKTSVFELQRIHVELLIQKKLRQNESRNSAIVDKPQQNKISNQANIQNRLDRKEVQISKMQPDNLKIPDTRIAEIRSSETPLQQSQIQDSTSEVSNLVGNQIYKRYCPDHREEEIMYFCFQCSSRCICPECVIHGTHKNHEVKTIKKAYPIIRSKVDEFSQKINFKLKQLSQRTIQLDTFAQDLQANATSLKNQIQLEFGELRQKLDAKEREFEQVCDRVLADNLKEIEVLRESLEDKQQEFAQTIELVFDHSNQPDETLLLDFYATNQQKLDEIKNNREWEKSLLIKNPEFYRVSQREIEKAILLLESQVQRIQPQLEVNDSMNAKQFVDQSDTTIVDDKRNNNNNNPKTNNNNEFFCEEQSQTPNNSSTNNNNNNNIFNIQTNSNNNIKNMNSYQQSSVKNNPNQQLSYPLNNYSTDYSNRQRVLPPQQLQVHIHPLEPLEAINKLDSFTSKSPSYSFQNFHPQFNNVPSSEKYSQQRSQSTQQQSQLQQQQLQKQQQQQQLLNQPNQQTQLVSSKILQKQQQLNEHQQYSQLNNECVDQEHSYSIKEDIGERTTLQQSNEMKRNKRDYQLSDADFEKFREKIASKAKSNLQENLSPSIQDINKGGIGKQSTPNQSVLNQSISSQKPLPSHQQPNFQFQKYAE